MKTLFEILSFDERILVLSSQEDEVIFTWNQSLTLQCWSSIGRGLFEERNLRTLMEEPAGFAEAKASAQRWYLDLSLESEDEEDVE